MSAEHPAATTGVIARMWAFYVLLLIVVGLGYLGSVVLHAVL